MDYKVDLLMLGRSESTTLLEGYLPLPQFQEQ